MVNVILDGSPIGVDGQLPTAGSKAPTPTLIDADLKDALLADFAGKREVLNIMSGLSTPVYIASTRKSNRVAIKLGNTVVPSASADLSFTTSRFCTTEGVANAKPLLTFHDEGFKQAYGVGIMSGPLAGVVARIVTVLNVDDTVLCS